MVGHGSLFGGYPCSGGSHGGGSRELSSESNQEAHLGSRQGALFGAVPGSTLRGGSERPACPWAPLRGRSRARRCRSSRRRFGGRWTPSSSVRSKDTRAARRFGGRSLLGTAGIDSTELARDEPLLYFGRDAADHPSTTDRFGGHDSTVADRDGDEPFGARRCLLRSFGGAAQARSSRRFGAGRERTEVRGLEGSTGCSGRLDDVDHGRPSLVDGTVWATARVTTHRTSREHRPRWGEPRRWLRLRPVHTGLRPRVSLLEESSRT